MLARLCATGRQLRRRSLSFGLSFGLSSGQMVRALSGVPAFIGVRRCSHGRSKRRAMGSARSQGMHPGVHTCTARATNVATRRPRPRRTLDCAAQRRWFLGSSVGGQAAAGNAYGRAPLGRPSGTSSRTPAHAPRYNDGERERFRRQATSRTWRISRARRLRSLPGPKAVPRGVVGFEG
jgi:hypothetical protein